MRLGQPDKDLSIYFSRVVAEHTEHQVKSLLARNFPEVGVATCVYFYETLRKSAVENVKLHLTEMRDVGVMNGQSCCMDHGSVHAVGR